MRYALLGLTVCIVAAAGTAGPAKAHSLCRSLAADGTRVDPFGRPCVNGQVFHGGADLFVGPPVVAVPEVPQHRRIPRQQSQPSFGFTTGSIGPFTTGPLSPSTTQVAPAPFGARRP